MFGLVFVTLISIGITYFFYRHRSNQQFLQQRFDQVIGLRQLIDLLRFHRRQTHKILTLQGKPVARPMLAESLAIKRLSETLLSQAEQAHKPMYRVLQQRTSTMLSEWHQYNIQRNQAVHGKMIRHVLYLIDDTITQSLLNTDKATQFQHYQTIWPIILNAIDNLTRYRCAIEKYQTGIPTTTREIEVHVDIFHRRLEQISMQVHQPIPPLFIDNLRQQFNAIQIEQLPVAQARLRLYQHSLKLSDALYLLFDLVLNDIADDIAVNLPKRKQENATNETSQGLTS